MKHGHFVLVAFVAGCSSPSAPSSTSASTDAGGSVTDAASETAPAAPCSEPMEEWISPDGQCVKTVSGKVLDTTGAPVPKKAISVCGPVCFYGATGADGSFLVSIGKHISPPRFSASLHARPEYAGLFVVLPTTSSDTIVLPNIVVPKFEGASDVRIPFDEATNTIATAASVGSGEVTLNFQADTKVELDLEDVAIGPPGELFHVAKVESKDFPAFAKDAGIVALYATAPFDSKYSKKVGVSIATGAGLPAGSVVEFVALGYEFLKTPPTAGTLQVVATGKVSSDGSKIETDAGEGLDYLTWIGVRPKP